MAQYPLVEDLLVELPASGVSLGGADPHWDCYCEDRGLSIVRDLEMIIGPVVCSRKSDTSRGWDGYVPRYIQMYLQRCSPVKGVTLCPGVSIVVVGT